MDQTEIAQYRLHTYQYGIDLGKQFGNWGEIRTGIQREQGHSHLEIGDPGDPLLQTQPNQDFGVHDYFVRFSYDRLDNVNFPHSGQQASLQWDANRNVTGVDNVTNQVAFSYTGAASFGRDTLVLSANAGMTLEGNVNDVRLLYPLGGFLNLSGLRADSLLGPDFAIARVLYYRQVGRGGPGYFDFPTYVGVSFEDGNVWQNRRDITLGNNARTPAFSLASIPSSGLYTSLPASTSTATRHFIYSWDGRSRHARRTGARRLRAPGKNHAFCRPPIRSTAPVRRKRRRLRAPGDFRPIKLEAAALGELFDFLEDQRRLVGGAGVLVSLAHLRQRGVALFRRRRPVQPVPFRAQKLAERIAGRKAHAHPIGAQLLDRRDAEVLRLADSHSRGSLRGEVADRKPSKTMVA